MKNYYAIKREIYKNNQCSPCDTIYYHKLYKTEEEAVTAIRKWVDNEVLVAGHKQIGELLETMVQGRTKKNGDIDVFRHEWSYEKFTVEGE